MWNRSEIFRTRSTPHRRNAASNTSSLPVSAPVCELAGLRCGFRPARLDHDDRFAERHFARRRKKAARIADRFHVSRMLCVCGSSPKKSNQVAPAHVEHRSGRNNGAEPYILLQTPVENRRQQSAALAEKRDIARLHDALRKRRVRAPGPDSSFPGSSGRRGAFRCAGVPPEFGVRVPHLQRPSSLNPAEITIDERTPASTHSPNDPRNGWRGRYNDSQLHSLRNGADACIARKSENVGAARINRIDLAGEVSLDEIIQDRPPDAPFPVGCADHGHRFRPEETIESGAASHAYLCPLPLRELQAHSILQGAEVGCTLRHRPVQRVA